MKLSVIIPAYGREESLVRCLISLKEDIGDDIDCEVCVVDDGSGLDEDSIRMRVAAGHAFTWRSFSDVRGRSAARNEGVRSTQGDIIIFLDSDMEVRSGFLRGHLRCHLDHPHAAVIGRIDWPKGGGFFRYIGTRGVAKLKPGEPVPPWYFVTGNASVERRDLTGENPFDETLPGWGGEDLELGMQLSEKGVTFQYAPDAASYHLFTGDLAGHIKRTRGYGRDALPVLVDRHPELLGILKLDKLDSLFYRMAVHGIFFHPVMWFARLFGFLPLPTIMYDYLTFASYAGGWLRGRGRAPF